MRLQKIKESNSRHASLIPFENDLVEQIIINIDKKTWEIQDEILLDLAKITFNNVYEKKDFSSMENGIELDNVFYYLNSAIREDKVLLVDIKILTDKEKDYYLEYYTIENRLN